MSEPTREQWQALFAAAEEFRQLAPWQWLTGEELFAVEDPTSREVGYCSVMGEAGEEFGLAMFVGAEGFAAYHRLMEGDVEPESVEAAAPLWSLSLTFSDREDLESKDREVMRSLGLRFRGRNAWPLFRSQRPGYFPWFLEAEEAEFLELALRQAVTVARRVQAGDVQLSSGLDGKPVLTRCYREGRWVDEWRQPELPAPTAEDPLAADPARLAQLQQTKARGRESWAVDWLFVPTLIGARGQRPYFPRLLLVVNQQGFILATDLLEPWAPAAQRQAVLLAAFEDNPQLPREILVPREEASQVVAAVAKALGIRVRQTRVPMLEEVRKELFAQFS